jgi:hypothetical protein
VSANKARSNQTHPDFFHSIVSPNSMTTISFAASNTTLIIAGYLPTTTQGRATITLAKTYL